MRVPIKYGPLDGGYFQLAKEPEHLVAAYTSTMPSDSGWSPDKPVPEECMRQSFSSTPSGRREAKYVYSARIGKFLYDRTGVF